MHSPAHEEELLGFAMGEPDAIANRAALLDRLVQCAGCTAYAYSLLPVLCELRADGTAPPRFDALLLDAAEGAAAGDAARARQGIVRRLRELWSAPWIVWGAGAGAVLAAALVTWFVWPSAMPPLPVHVDVIRNADLSESSAERAGERIYLGQQDSIALRIPEIDDFELRFVLVVAVEEDSSPPWIAGDIALAASALFDEHGEQRGVVLVDGDGWKAQFAGAVFLTGSASRQIIVVGCASNRAGLPPVQEIRAALLAQKAPPNGCAVSRTLALERSQSW